MKQVTLLNYDVFSLAMDERSEKRLGLVLIFVGVSLWQLLPGRVSFERILIIHMSMVLPGVYLFEKPFIKYIIHRIRGGA